MTLLCCSPEGHKSPGCPSHVHPPQLQTSRLLRKVLRRLVEGGEESARLRLASSARLVEDVASVVLTARPGYPLAWQAAVQGVAACREVLDGHMTPVMFQRCGHMEAWVHAACGGRAACMPAM